MQYVVEAESEDDFRQLGAKTMGERKQRTEIRVWRRVGDGNAAERLWGNDGESEREQDQWRVWHR